MNGKISSLAALALLLAAGCSIPYGSLDLEQTNVCSADSDCPQGSACAALDGKYACIATSVDLPALTFEVRSALTNGAYTTSTLLPHGPLSAGGAPQIIDVPLNLPAFVDVSPGRVYLPCGGADPVPAKVTFQPVPGLAGLLEGQKYQSDSTTDAAGNQAFKAKVPPGLYDIYFEPQADPEVMPDCAAAPPIFLPRQSISKDTGFSIHASEPLVLTGTLKLSDKEDFTKWFLEVVEPYGGQPISPAVQPEQSGLALEVPFHVQFDWSARNAPPEQSFTPIIRLRPPVGSGKPVIHWRLDGVALQGVVDGQVPVKLDVSGIDTQPRQVGGTVFHDTSPVAATVTLRSKLVSDDDLTRYETTVETDQAGNFQSALPPGEYQVIARPHDKDKFAVGSDTWHVLKGADCYCGQSITVPSATTLAGLVSTPGGAPANVQVRLTPAAKGTLLYLGTMINPGDVQPRPASATTQEGEFKVSVDAGSFDLSLVAATDSGYPWLVRPRLSVSTPTASSGAVVSLKELQLQSPVVVRGAVFGADGQLLRGATVRAWIAVSDPADQSIEPSAVQIGEAVVDSSGSYVLHLPPSIKQGK